MGVDKLDRIFIMKYKRLLALLIAALLLSAPMAVAAQKPEEKKHQQTTEYRKAPKITTEFGLGVGARYNWFNVQPISQDFTPNISMMLSYGAALQFRLNIGRTFGFQPEISYARAKVKIKDNVNNFSTNANSNIVQLPMLLSFRIAMFRLNFGPVFTLMDDTTYQLAKSDDESIQKVPLGKLYPAVTYAAGISVKFAGIMMIDVRYADQFTGIKSENQYLWTLDQNKQPKAQSFRTSTRSVQLRFGFVF